MFSIVHVILPFSETSPAEAIRGSLARFERGARGDVPDEWLAFSDETAHVRALHTGRWVFTSEGPGGLRIEGPDHWLLDTKRIRAEMERRALRRWTVCFADAEPDLDAFSASYVTGLERHPVTGGFGRWLNTLGRWDWWDLGGRFDGRITGQRHQHGRPASSVSSGPNTGRQILANVRNALDRVLGTEAPAEVDIRADDNVEMVSRLAEDARGGHRLAIPGAILLPPGSVDDRLRWIGSWPDIGPADAVSHLGLPETASWESIVMAAYDRFPDHWAAGIAYHL